MGLNSEINSGMVIRRQHFKFLPVEWILILYLVATTLLILIFWSNLQNPEIHILLRIIVIAAILLFAGSKNTLQSRKTFYYLRWFFPVLLLGYLYKETDYLNNLLFRTDLDPLFAFIDEAIFGMQPSLEFASRFPSGFFAELMYFGYCSYYLLIVTVPVYLFGAKQKEAAEEVISITIGSFMIFYLLFILLPVAGPQYYFAAKTEPVHQRFLFGPLLGIILEVGEGRTAAFPSSHISIYLILLYSCIQYARKLLAFVVPAGVLLFLSTLYLQAHYVIDIIFGIIYTPLVYLLAEKYYMAFKTKNKINYGN